MNKEITFKLWVVKFCLKIIYPKFNYHSFLVYLAVKYRKLHYKKLTYGVSMDPTYKIVPISPHVQRLLTKQHLEDNTAVISHKCLVISRSHFIDLASENFFYLDNNVLWLSLKLSPRNFKKYKEKQNKNNKDKLHKYNLNFISSEIHKKLWAGKGLSSVEKSRIVPVIGSQHVEENVISTNETETYNIASSFGLNISDIEICLHPVPRLECAPKIAAAAEVSLIVNDYDLSNDFVKEVLNNYFEIPKLIHTNDMFSIDLTPEITAQYHYKYSDLVELTGKLYFKCHLIDGSLNENKCNEDMEQPFYIVKGVTQLSLGESIHETKPKEEYFKLQKSSTTKQLLTICPNGLKNKFDQIQESIAPFLTGNLNELTSSLCSPIIPILLLTGSLGSGRHLIMKALAKYNGLNYLQIDCNALQSSTAKQTESKISSTIQRAKTASPAIVVLDNFEVFAVDPENNEDCRLIEYFENSLSDLYQHYTKHVIVFVAVTDKMDLKPNIQRIFLDKFHIPKLDSKQRCEMLEWFVSVMGLELDNADKVDRHNIDENISTKDVLQKVAAKTETFKYGDMDTLVHFALRESYLHQQNNTNIVLPDLNMNLVREQHFDSALESMRTLQSQHLDAPKIPKVYWEDIGGLEHLKKELLKTIEFPIKYPHLFKNSSLKRSGILLYGPPGCGKTLVAKAVSTEMNVSFLSVKGPELLNMYIGQSEENVRRVFESARASSPCIIFLDELDSMAARRGAAGDSGGASDRLVSQLLAELDGVTTQDAESSSFVFVIGATNRPDLLEQSLLRPGRLDKLVYVGPYCGEEKTQVLTSLCRKHKLDPGVDLSLVSSALPERCTGADLQQVVSGARASALRTLVGRLKDGLIKESDLSADSVVIGEEDIRAGLSAFRPSVTDQELAHYESLRRQM